MKNDAKLIIEWIDKPGAADQLLNSNAFLIYIHVGAKGSVSCSILE